MSVGRAHRVAEPFHTFDWDGNEYVIEHGNVAIDAPTEVRIWPIAQWQAERDRREAAK